jgi:cytochrome b involved in lipid metabolism
MDKKSSTTNNVAKKSSYTWKEISENNKKSSCWVVLNGSVYDLTNYLRDHPGGASKIMEYAGRDCTKAFSMIFF